MENGLISVDRWTAGSQVYFLTHLHSDHTQGLTSGWARGAVMFLFRGDFGCLLYTGDFRWETTGERAKMGRAMLVNALNGRTVDNLHLDNTYCNPSYDFPPREVAAQEIVNLIASHPKHDVVIGIDSLGKEDLLLHIALSLGIKIWVWPERLQTMHILGFHDTFTTKTSLTRVRAVPRYSFSIETLEALNATRPTIGIMPSGLPWVVRPVKGDANLSVQPTIVKGIVCSSACYVEPLYFFGRLCGVFSVDSHVQTKRRSERAADVEINKSAAESGVEAVRKKMRSRAYYAAGGVKVSRTSVLRRVSRGAKIMDNDSAD
ncbi:unnamed protein product [Linum tenue]|uniref:5' exonuclease Apollo n=1 Tax=Linum tenue TaxID=586396 RepID=A0AAV0R0T6_9ROSI|nr:unnamed protein product [Linum tenue]